MQILFSAAGRANDRLFLLVNLQLSAAGLGRDSLDAHLETGHAISAKRAGFTWIRFPSPAPQHVTVHGRAEVVVIAAEDFRRLKGEKTGRALINALQASPLDLSKARRIGTDPKRVNVDFPGWMVDALDREARRMGVTRQSLIKLWLADKLGQQAAAGSRGS